MSTPFPSETEIRGVGLGLRFPHFSEILRQLDEGTLATPWFEVIADDFLNPGPHFEKLEILRSQRPIVFHSIGMNLGGVDEHSLNYLKVLKEIYLRFQPDWISDHLCWSRFEKRYHHDLLPIPRSHEALENACARIQFLQDYFQRPLVIENITAYVDFRDEDFNEAEFLREILERTGCFLLLDLTNLIINQKNRENRQINAPVAPAPFTDYPLDKVVQMHIAGGDHSEALIIDTHSQPVEDKDIQWLKELYRQGTRPPVMIERDYDIPAFHVLEAERKKVEESLHGL